MTEKEKAAVGYLYNTYVGNYFFANHNCQILDGGKVTFGNRAFCKKTNRGMLIVK